MRYVDVNNAAPAPPYTTWATAATRIQDAVDVAATGDEILVTNGVYQTGARAVNGGTSTRVAVTKPVTVRSVNGPAVTVIDGSAAVRCVYLTNGTVLAGFTLTNGATGDNGSGGGVWCEGLSAVVSNCVLTGNSASSSGGGAYRGTLNNCTLTGNRAAFGGGAAFGTLNNCTLRSNTAAFGGGADAATLNNCTLTSNTAYSYGGGAYESTLNNCALTGNTAENYGGGACFGMLNNCTLTGNSAAAGGGAYGGSLNNCTLSGNTASDGGGAYGGTLSNCTLRSNTASFYGGGAKSATLGNCTLAGNTASSDGGGTSGGILNNCTLTGNTASSSGGGAYTGTLNNCIVFYNAASIGANHSGGTLNYCCTTPLPASGTGNTTADPQLASSSHLSVDSPCRGAGSAAYAQGMDIDGEPWGSPPSIGCDEYWSGSVTGVMSVAISATYTNLAAGFSAEFQAVIGGRISRSSWDFGDGTGVSNQLHASHAWAVPGDYAVVLRAWNESFPSGVSATVVVQVVSQPVHHVALTGTGAVAPYDSWATAATNIQDAVDAAGVPGSLVLVSDGVYQTGARAVYGMSNRVAVTKPVTVRSVNGPAVTHIVGYQVPGATNGPEAVRCVYLTGGAAVSGFTLTNGATQTSGDSYRNRSGGGLWCEGSSAVVSNCVLTGNTAYHGGAASGGTLHNCTLTGNSASSDGGGVYGGTLHNCALTGNSASSGSGAFRSTLNDCTLTGNSASHWGGGAYGGTLINCTLTGNSAGDLGGGACSGTLNHCTLAGNSANHGGGAYDGTLNDCTLTGNSARYSGGGAYLATLNNCVLTGNSAEIHGGGAAGDWNNYCTLNNCVLTGNSARSYGGGAFAGTLNNCALAGNSAEIYGGGACYGTLNNCTLAGNSAAAGGGAFWGSLNNCTITGNSASSGGGAYGGSLNNCIVYYNRAISSGPNYRESTLNYCCTSPLPDGPGNLTNAPLLVDTNGWSDLRLQATSSCVGTGNNAYAPGSTDLAGNPRIVGRIVDMGAYESQPGWSAHPLFGWLWSAGDRWLGGSAYGWMWFDAGGQWIWSTSLQGWMAITDPNSRTLWSVQFRWLTPAADDLSLAATSSLGPIHVGVYHGTLIPDGTPITDGWVVSDRFGFVWAAGDGVWFFSTLHGWLGVTPDGGIWCVDQARFL
jgi:parallel beta-helix repeat protein